MILAILILYILSVVGIGIYCRKRLPQLMTSYSAAEASDRGSRLLHTVHLIFGRNFVGYAGKFGWNFGLASTWIGIGNAILGSLLPWLILGRRTRVMSKHLESATMPEFSADASTARL